jgi:phosphodiesterase/alkaline phosphatase D-like protein
MFSESTAAKGVGRRLRRYGLVGAVAMVTFLAFGVQVAAASPEAPTVVTGSASSITETEATLNATVNPNGSEVTECKFEYGQSELYGSSVSCESSPGSGTSPVAVSARATGLKPGLQYHFRISATNAGGTSNGSDEVFHTLFTPPSAVTETAAPVGPRSATLHGQVNPDGFNVFNALNTAQVKIRFERAVEPARKTAYPCPQN